jgi:hypothetical protein
MFRTTHDHTLCSRHVKSFNAPYNNPDMTERRSPPSGPTKAPMLHKKIPPVQLPQTVSCSAVQVDKTELQVEHVRGLVERSGQNELAGQGNLLSGSGHQNPAGHPRRGRWSFVGSSRQPSCCTLCISQTRGRCCTFPPHTESESPRLVDSRSPGDRESAHGLLVDSMSLQGTLAAGNPGIHKRTLVGKAQ